MSARSGLYWLPEMPDWRARAMALGVGSTPSWKAISMLANARLDLSKTNALDGVMRRTYSAEPPSEIIGQPIRVAVLGSSTLEHLHSSIRIGGARRGLWLEVYQGEYGQYFQELLDNDSGLYRFKPDTILFAFDARYLTRGLTAASSLSDAQRHVEGVLQQIRQSWMLARNAFGCSVIQQSVINVFPPVLGQNEHRLAGSRSSAVACLNAALRTMSDTDGVDLVSIDQRVQLDGLNNWYDASLWYRTKQEISPTSAPMYGDMVARLIAAKRGLSKKCLVLDLDNTLWGGVLGDDGIDGIVLGEGSGEGEAFLAFQDYAMELSRRGIVLAVNSKNDEENVLEAFDRHPEILLKRQHIASFQANWNDKVTNMRAIAASLNLGLESWVFFDDNPFERSLVRMELPMVAVPEFPDDVAFLPQMLADAGYFEGIRLTNDDMVRAEQYQDNIVRDTLKSSSTDLQAYLESLDMELIWAPIDEVGMQRAVQLINKTNQFNLTTRRHTEESVRAMLANPNSLGLQLRLVDRFGDNGVISIIIGFCDAHGTFNIDTWLMSCRVLGRGVEKASLNLVVQEAKLLGASRLLGEYIPSVKNDMVRNHYQGLGFIQIKVGPTGSSLFELLVEPYQPIEACIKVKRA
jgi:FkbH-like protein